MNIQIKFKNINRNPKCRIFLNKTKLYEGIVNEHYNFDVNDDSYNVELEIEHFDKFPNETIVNDNGEIIDDRSFELESLIIDDQNFEELIWESKFVDDHGNIYNSCLFFGPNGKFVIEFTQPVLRWMLEFRYKRDGGDPLWEENFNLYYKAWKLLKQI